MNILEQTASAFGVSIEEVRKEIEIAIKAAQKEADGNNELWKALFPEEDPTPEKFVSALSQAVAKKHR